MAAAPPTADGGAVIELDEVIDGPEIGSRNYRFSKIGESVPINSEFDPQSLPAQPLATSERFRLLFVAHPQGFYVVRTNHLIGTAEEIKEKKGGQSVKELSVVDVPIGKVSILALSSDESLLAASMDSHVHFFAVSALLHKDQEPSFSVSLDDSSCIRDVRWAKKAGKSYLVLSASGKLYHGSGQGPLKHVMDGVDSFDWSVKGDSVAVAKSNSISILSPELKEKSRFLLPVAGDSDVNTVIKVDSIRWIRSDCIFVGCFQLNDDEEIYVVQVITSKDGKLTDEASKPTVLSFSNVFLDFYSDAVPTRNGPHLFLSYLDLYGLAFIANRNLSRQVGLFCWPRDSEKNEASMVEILDDAWTLHIDSQDNDEDNVILGLSVDKVSQNENIRFTLGDIETEVSPCCVIVCLTIDGKISIFHFASAAGTSVSPEASDEETVASPVLEKNIMPLISSTAGKGSNDPAFSMSEPHKISGFEVEKTGAKATITNDLVPSVNVDTKSLEKATSGNMGHKPLVYSKTVEADAPEKAPPLVLNQVSNAENQPLSEVKQSTGFFSGKLGGDFPHQSISKELPGRVEPFHKAPPTSSQSLWSLSGSSAKVGASETSDVGNLDKHAVQLAGHAVQQPTDINEKVKPFVTSTFGHTSSSAQGHRNTLQAYPGSQVPLGETFALGKSFQSGLKKDLNSSSSATWLSHSVQNASSAKVDTSKTFDGRLFSSDVGNSDKHALQSAGHAVRQSTDINEKVKPFVTSTSFGQKASTAQGHRNPLQAYPGSQVPLGGSSSSGKPFQSDFKKDLNSSSSATRLPYSVQNASKQFGNVEEMAKKLDILLEGIEGKGGFLDASITSQTNSVTELEDSIWALSGRCRTWKGLMNEQLRELQLLLDKTVQVLVRKVYMEGVFKQTTDSRYLELWNRQKLSSELELKRRRISELNQELTNKLIELERHFNSLEFNKFGETGGMQRNRRVLQNGHGHSRQTQSLHSLHNTMQAQLAAAEHLSGCLSSQMAALSIESSETQDAKKKLFESIGLSFGDTERSPARNRTSGTPLNKEHLITSTSIASKEHTRRNQTSFAKSPETARRRRDSLDCSWASFEPSKTTVKRVLKEDYDQGNASRSLLNIDKQYLSPQSQKKSEPANSNILRTSRNSFKSKGTLEIPDQHTQSRFTSLHQKTADSLDNGNQVLSTKSSYALPPPSILDTRTTQNNEQVAFKLIDDKSKGSLPSIGKKDSFAAGVSNFVHKQPDTSLRPSPPSISSQQSLKSPFVTTETSDHFKLDFTKSKTEDQKKNTSTGPGTTVDSKIPVNPASAFFGSGTNVSDDQKKNTSTEPGTTIDSKIPVNPASGFFGSVTNVSEKGSFTKYSEKSSQTPNDNSKASIPSQSPVGSSLFSSNNVPSFASFSKPSSSTLFPITPSSSGFSVSTKQDVSRPQTSSIPESNLLTMSPSSSSSIGKSESQTSSLSHTPVDNTPPETEKDISKIQQASASQPGFSSTPGLNLGPATSSSPTELSTDQKINSGGLSNISSSVASVSKTEQVPSATEGGIKTVVPNSSHEEEMEEEAPEATELSLGSLGGFGIGSTPNSGTPKSNPFGVVNLNQNTSFTPSPNSGELFRPASFNFQPPQQPPQPVQPMTVNFSGAGNSGQAVSGFGQPTHIGAGQQALGTVLGSFGQSRQLGAGLPGGNSVAPAIGFGGGAFGGGFASAAPSAGGFAGLAAGSGGFAAAGGGFAAAAAGGGGGFAAAATGNVGGFAAAATGGGGGFAAAATGGGGGFGGFGNQQGGGGGFSAFGGGSTAARPPSQVFTQMRK